VRVTGNRYPAIRTLIIPTTYADEEDINILIGMTKRYNILVKMAHKEIWQRNANRQKLYFQACIPVQVKEYKAGYCTMRNQVSRKLFEELKKQYPDDTTLKGLNYYRSKLVKKGSEYLIPSKTAEAGAEAAYQNFKSYWAVKKSRSNFKYLAGDTKTTREHLKEFPIVFKKPGIKLLHKNFNGDYLIPDVDHPANTIRLSLGVALNKVLKQRYIFIPVKSTILKYPIKVIAITGLSERYTKLPSKKGRPNNKNSHKQMNNYNKMCQEKLSEIKTYTTPDIHISYEILVPEIDPELANIKNLPKKSLEVLFNENRYKVMGIDPGGVNLMALADNTGNRGIVFKLGTLKGLLNGPTTGRTPSRSSCYNLNQALLGIASEVVYIAVKRGIDIVVFGHNKGIKNKKIDSTGKVLYNPNALFRFIPHISLMNKVRNSCEKAGIVFIETEESYTSHTDHLILESMTTTKEDWQTRKKRRVNRGLFKTESNLIPSGYINSDWNGALGIARKIFGDSFIITLPKKHLGGIEVITK